MASFVAILKILLLLLIERKVVSTLDTQHCKKNDLFQVKSSDIYTHKYLTIGYRIYNFNFLLRTGQ